MIELSDQAIALLREPLLAHLATINRDGSIQVTPLWIDVEDGRPVFNTAAGRVKDRNLLRDPRCTIEIVSAADDEIYLEVRGRAVERVVDHDHVHADEVAVKYTGEAFRDLGPDEERIKWYVEPERALGPASR
jgi:PPOX class probable F420-dependent enzyme